MNQNDETDTELQYLQRSDELGNCTWQSDSQRPNEVITAKIFRNIRTRDSVYSNRWSELLYTAIGLQKAKWGEGRGEG